MSATPEYQLYKQISQYMRYQYPTMLFRFDMDGLKLTVGQAKKNKAIQHSKGWPDLWIYEARGQYHGLAIELKPEGTKLFKKDSDFVNEHIKEQFEMLEKLEQKGYCARMCIGWYEAKRIIDEYLKERKL